MEELLAELERRAVPFRAEEVGKKEGTGGESWAGERGRGILQVHEKACLFAGVAKPGQRRWILGTVTKVFMGSNTIPLSRSYCI
jgi:hypothetical protein